MALGGIAEDCVKSVVCRQSSISCLFPGTGSETVLHSNLPIIEDHSGRDTAEQVKSPDERVEKTFFVLPVVSKNDRPAAVTQPRTEEIYCLSVSIYVHLCLAPVDLHRFTRIELERDESIRMGILQFMYFGTDRRFSSSESSFLDEPVVDPFGGMFLFRKAFRFVFFQALPDKVNSFICEDGRLPFGRFTIPGDRVALAVFLNGISGNAEGFRDMALAFTGEISLADLFIILHSDYHFAELNEFRFQFINIDIELF